MKGKTLSSSSKKNNSARYLLFPYSPKEKEREREGGKGGTKSTMPCFFLSLFFFSTPILYPHPKIMSLRRLSLMSNQTRQTYHAEYDSKQKEVV